MQEAPKKSHYPLRYIPTYLNKATLEGILHLFSYELDTTLVTIISLYMKLLLIARTSSTIGSIVCLYLINLIVYIIQYVNERLSWLFSEWCYASILKLPSWKTFKSFICGEYRSRTDDLLNANQAL